MSEITAGGSGSRNFTVSQDFLRAELKDLELRIFERLRSDIAGKADKVQVDSLQSRLAFFEGLNLTEMRSDIKEIQLEIRSLQTTAAAAISVKSERKNLMWYLVAAVSVAVGSGEILRIAFGG